MTQTITPYLGYEDTNRAIEWLSEAFGFRETVRYENEDGKVTHAELALGEGHVFLGWPGPDFRAPRDAGYTVSIHVYVDEIDAHYERARAAGAEITRSPADEAYGDRRYDCRDPEGHRWHFAQHIRDVTPEEWGAKRTS